MREKAVKFGKTAALTGILVEPTGELDQSRPAFVIVNSGIMHRIGTCRISVMISRAAADAGFLALRFDLSGIGDSGPRKDSLPFEQSAPREAQEAMDYLTASKGVKTFIMMGLCSGADMSYETSLLDERAVGLMQIDAYAYRNWKWYVKHYGPRMRQLDTWKRFAGRVRAKVEEKYLGKTAPAKDAEDLELPSYVRVFPPVDSIREGLRKLTARKLHFFYIYTGDEQAYNYPGQHQDVFADVDFGGRLRCEYLKEADHIVTGLDHQQYVTREIAAWAARIWPAAAQSRGASPTRPTNGAAARA